MPGRQAHGRSLMGGNGQSAGKGKGKARNQKSKSKARAHAMDAFAIAAKQMEPERITRRGRDLELDPERQPRKHRRDDDDDDDDEDDGMDEDGEDERPQKKRARRDVDEDIDDGHSEEVDGGSDSEGNEWHVGVNADDDDSELDSDEAFGDSDEEKFEGFAFRGSRARKDEDDEDEDGDDGESLGSDAIDLADALDQSSGSEDEGSAGDTESGSEEDVGESESEADEDDDEVDPEKLGDLQKIIKGYAETDKEAETDDKPVSKQTISLQDLGLTSVKDPLIKKSLKLMKKEEKAEATKKGTSKKLDVPLPRRQQDALLRAAAYEKTKETLNRWNDTVKHNRRADHLMFPLPQNAHDAGLDNGELQPLTKKTAGTELEQAIMSIMEESGLGPSAESKKPPETRTDANGEEQTISRAELKKLWAERRRERELESREQARAKRIKKIKSKAYRKIHRKERLGEEAEQLAAMRDNGEINSEEELEAAHRRRALERVGAKHKESKWAKMGSKVGRAVWDDDYRAGLTDMARRNEELRKRVEGRSGGGDEDDGSDDESDATSSSGDEQAVSKTLKQLDALDEDDDDDHPHANLRKLKFMQRAEAAQKQANDETIAQIRRDLASGSEPEEEDDTEVQVGRRTFGMGQDKKSIKSAKQTSGSVNGSSSNGGNEKSLSQASKKAQADFSASAPPPSAPGGPGFWTKVSKTGASDRKKSKKGASSTGGTELDLTGAVQLASMSAAAPKTPKPKPGMVQAATTDDGDSSDDGIHLPLAIRDHELVARAFAGEDVIRDFEAEKEAIMSEDDEKMVDNTMPGWGSWTGEGISKRAQKRNKGKVMTKKEGIKRKDRKDAKLDKVIINEKRLRKNEKYLATQLPHPFESRQQYERSLRLPVGPEWVTKESFQAATKPRVIVKQGIIAPMAKPTI